MKEFIPRKKLSKKARREYDSRNRLSWGNVNPVTRKTENKKAYNRKESQKGYDSYSETFVLAA